MFYCAGVFIRVFCFLEYKFWRCFSIANAAHQINEDIRDKEVRLISDTGEQLGIMSSAAALETALAKDLDLVKISPGSVPPVCKIMDYGKFRFEQSKREKEAKKNQHIVEVKEIRMSPGIGDNDFGTKLRSGQKFLTDGDRLKVTVRFRGRQLAHTEIGEQLLKRFAEECSAVSVLDKNPKFEGRSMSMFLSPKPSQPPK
jgi:translation initiation factor IF-3